MLFWSEVFLKHSRNSSQFLKRMKTQFFLINTAFKNDLKKGKIVLKQFFSFSKVVTKIQFLLNIACII